MQEMKFYQIDSSYLNILRQVDERVPLNKEFYGRKGARPYIGIMLSVENIDYFVPLSSKKKRTSFVVMPIYDSNRVQIASLLLNNMLPVPPKFRKLLNMDGVKITNPKYYDLLLNELNYLRPRTKAIKSRCAIIRLVIVEGDERPQINDKTKDYCLNLAELEVEYRKIS